MKTKSFDDLFLGLLKDIYYAERKILKALPRMARGAQSEELKTAFSKHAEETQMQIDRLQQVFELIGKPARGKVCPAIDGILEEGEEALEEYGGTALVDAALAASAQAVEHYEISRYGTLRRWAELLGQKQAAKLLEETLAEEETTDKLLTDLAESSLNAAALEAA